MTLRDPIRYGASVTQNVQSAENHFNYLGGGDIPHTWTFERESWSDGEIVIFIVATHLDLGYYGTTGSRPYFLNVPEDDGLAFYGDTWGSGGTKACNMYYWAFQVKDWTAWPEVLEFGWVPRLNAGDPPDSLQIRDCVINAMLVTASTGETTESGAPIQVQFFSNKVSCGAEEIPVEKYDVFSDIEYLIFAGSIAGDHIYGNDGDGCGVFDPLPNRDAPGFPYLGNQMADFGTWGADGCAGVEAYAMFVDDVVQWQLSGYLYGNSYELEYNDPGHIGGFNHAHYINPDQPELGVCNDYPDGWYPMGMVVIGWTEIPEVEEPTPEPEPEPEPERPTGTKTVGKGSSRSPERLGGHKTLKAVTKKQVETTIESEDWFGQTCTVHAVGLGASQSTRWYPVQPCRLAEAIIQLSEPEAGDVEVRCYRDGSTVATFTVPAGETFVRESIDPVLWDAGQYLTVRLFEAQAEAWIGAELIFLSPVSDSGAIFTGTSTPPQET